MIYTVLRSTAGVAHNKRGGYLIMVAGHLREKKGYFYAVLNYTAVSYTHLTLPTILLV